MRKAALLPRLLLVLGIMVSTARATWVEVEPGTSLPEFNVLSSSPSGLRIQLHFPGFESIAEEIDGQSYSRLQFEGYGSWGAAFGQPELPVLRKLVRLPATTGWSWKLIDAQYIELDGYRIAPLKEETVETPDGLQETDVTPDMTVYRQDRWIPDRPVDLGKPVIMRDFRLGQLELRPVLYNPAQSKLRVYRSITVEIRFEGDGENIIEHPRQQKSRVFGDLVRSWVINHDAFADNTDEVLGGYLIITPPSLQSSTWLTEFVKWKKQKGFPCTVVSTSVTGASSASITTYIQNNVYNTWPVPPDYLVLVGDNDYGMPTHYYSYTGNATDLPYTLMEGTDYFPDILAGRLSVDSETHLMIISSKTINYERNPSMSSTDWFNRGLMVYDYGGSLSCKNVKERCSDLMVEHGVTNVVHVTNPPTYYGAAAINSNVNTGVLFVNYRGYGSYSGWTPPNYSISDMSGLYNGFQLPVITSIVCGGGNFVSTSYDPCYGENWLRLGTSATNVKGAVAFMGPSSLYTHTRWNNCIDGGVYQGIFEEQVGDVASALLRGKMELYGGMPNNLGPGGTTSSVECYFHIYNILGDPGLAMWTGVPQELTVDHPADLALGQNYFPVSVTSGAGDVGDALVCVYNHTFDLQFSGWTDDNGEVLLDLTDLPAGDYTVTVTGHNLLTYQGTVTISQEAVALGIYNFMIDDDMLGESSGDGDGVFNPGETVELLVSLENTGNSTTATSVTGSITSDDPYVTITESSLSGPNAAPGATSILTDDFNLVLSTEAPHSHVVPLVLEASSAQGSWTNLINLDVVAPLAEAVRYEVQNVSGFLNPGESADVTILLYSSGGDPLINCSALLSSPDDKLTVTDNNGSWGTIAVGVSVENTANPFGLQAALDCPPGWTVPLQLIVTAEGYADTLTATFVVGEVTDADPAGPDTYGYYCFDSRDSLYQQAPEYVWFEASTQPGQETLPLYDYGNEEDDSVVRDLPFTFRYYGVDQNEVTICSNGWLCFGDYEYYHSLRNWNIPGALGPPGMVAPFWDDLRMEYGGTVHYFYDFLNYRQVIEWKNLRTAEGLGINTFEIFLYDPAYWASSTGEGIIVFQYHTFNNADYGENFCTVGIENYEQTDGVNVTYANIYSPGSATLQAGVALLFTNDIDYLGNAPNVEVTLTPYGTPIQIPASGGSFDYNIAVTNNESTQEIFSLWCDVTLPNGSIYGPILGPFEINLLPSMSVDRDRTQAVPLGAPAGDYAYNAYVGTYPGVVYHSDSFGFEKLIDQWDHPVSEWANDGESFDPWLVSTPNVTPTTFEMIGAFPNPFNPETTLRFALPEAGRVTLQVYDIAGRSVATLIDGWRNAGIHEAVFDGTGLASGMYFYRLQAGPNHSIGKMILLK